jgi:hypothetical protein
MTFAAEVNVAPPAAAVKSMPRIERSAAGDGMAEPVRPCPCGDNEMSGCTLHWLSIGMADRSPPLLGFGFS